MLNKLNQLAERSATSASRRQFLGSVGRGAMVLAAAAGGLLASPHQAAAAARKTLCPQGERPCWIEDPDTGIRTRGCCPGKKPPQK